MWLVTVLYCALAAALRMLLTAAAIPSAAALRLRLARRRAAVAVSAAASSQQQQHQEKAAPAGSGGGKVGGKTVVITGGSQGSGRAAARLFAKEGFNVVVIARKPERLQAVADEITANAKRESAALAVPGDISDRESVKQAAKKVFEKYANVDVLVNCAGICVYGSFLDTTDEDWDKLLGVNLLGAVNLSKVFLPALLKSKGTLINVNSFAARIPIKGMSAYTASKYALKGLTECLRYDYGKQGVHVAQVHPGVIASDFLERAEFRGENVDEAKKQLQQVLSMPTAQKPEDIAKAIWDAYTYKKDEVVVGALFSAAIRGYEMFGVNPFGTTSVV
eukprot:jgi/Chlat1/4199/Chrsp27S04292